MNELIAAMKALSDEGRVRALTALSGGELCLCHLIELLGLAPSTVSRHMTVLYQAGLVEMRKDGRWNYYRPAGDSGPPIVRAAAMMLEDALKKDPVIRADSKRLKSIRRMPLGDLCTHYQKGA